MRTSCDAIFEHNPYIQTLDESTAMVIETSYTDLVNQCNQIPHSFLRGYTRDLGKRLGIPLDLRTNRPFLFLSPEEKSWISQVHEQMTKRRVSFWIVDAGVKSDFTLKQWPFEYYQEVVNRLRGVIQFVQVGRSTDRHLPLDGVINLIDQTDARQLIRLCWWAEGGLGPITFIQHIFAAFDKPYVALLGGREPVSWVQYPLQTTLHTMGALECCRSGACWRSRVVPLGDGEPHDGSLCEFPVLGMKAPVGRCMALIKPDDVVRSILRYYEGGARHF